MDFYGYEVGGFEPMKICIWVKEVDGVATAANPKLGEVFTGRIDDAGDFVGERQVPKGGRVAKAIFEELANDPDEGGIYWETGIAHESLLYQIISQAVFGIPDVHR